MSDLKVQGVVEMNAEGAERTLDGLGNSAAKMAVNMQQAGEKAGKAIDQIGEIAKSSGEKLTRQEGAMVSSIKRLAAEAAKAKDIAEGLGNVEFNIAAKGLDPAKFAPMMDVIKSLSKESQIAASVTSSSMNTMGISAKQLSASLRGVPAQFTDIITSLQGGQAPLTVMLQQGGQLKDMFGGVGNAAKALGGYVMSLVNPYTVAAASAGLLATALYKGSNESRILSESLIITGNAAGQSVDSIYKMAAGVSALSLSSKGLSAEALSQVAATGKVASSNLSLVSEAAIKMQKATGSAIEDTVKQFAELGKSPVDASVKLTEKYNFLTGEIYLQIKALEDQGRTLDAAALAQKEYANSLIDRSDRIISELGSIQKAWVGLGNVAKQAWDSMLGIGRAETLESKLAAAIRERDGYVTDRGNGNLGSKTVPGNAAAQAQVEAIQKQIELRDKIADSEKEQAVATAKTIETQKLREKYLTNEKKLAQEIALINNSAMNTEEKRAAIAQATARLAEKAKAAPKVSNEYAELFAYSERMSQISKELAAEFKDIEQANQAYAKAVSAMLDPLAKEANALETEAMNFGLSRTEIEANTLAKLEEAQATAALNGASEEHISFLQREIELRKRIRDASANIDQKKAWDEAQKASDKAARESLEEWKKTSEKIGDSITDALMRGFESGKGFAENMRDSIKNMFSTLVLRPIVQATVVGGLSAVGLGANAATGAAGTLSDAGSVISTGNSAFNIYNGGSSLYSNFATSGVGSALGLSTGLASSLGVAGGAGSVMGGSAALAAAEATSIGGASALTGLGSTIGAAIPWVSAALAVGSLLDGVFESGERFPRTTASQTGTYKDGDFTNTGEAAYYNSGPDFGTSVDKALNRLNKQYSESLSALMESLGEEVDIETDARVRLRRTSGALATDFYAKINGVDIVQWQKYGKDGEDMAGSMEQFFNDVMSKGIIKGINATNIDDAIKGLFADLESVDNTSTMLTNVVNLATYSSELNDVWGVSIAQAAKVASSVSDSNDALISTVGAMATFAASQRSIGETLAATYDTLTETFADLSSAEFPTTLNAYDAAMKGVNKTTEAGIQTFSDLFAMREQFAAFQSAIDSLKASALSSVYDLRSPQAQSDLQQTALENAAKSAGVSVPKTASELVSLADAIDYTSEAGINFAAALPNLVTAFKSAQSALSSFYDRLKTIAGMRADVFDDIFEAQLSGMSSSGQIAALKEKEKGLWADLQGGDLGAASSLQEAILQRIELESQVKIDATNEQLTAAEALLESMQSIADYSRSVRDEMLSLQAGDLSALGFKEQLEAAKTLYTETLAKAKTGDTTAQSSLSGARTSYLSEAQGYYGSNADYASIFNSVVNDMNSLSLGAPTTTDIESQQIVVERLTDATNSQVNLSKEQVEALKKIDAILAQQQENTEAQLVQNGAAYTDILAVLREIDKRLLSVESTNRQAALA